jgi:hypothetical protein
MVTSIVALTLVVGGCQSPFLVFSGGALTGPVAETGSFAFADEYALLRLEVRPEKPYSVNLRVVTHDGELYIDAAERRRWQYLKVCPNVRVSLGGNVYRATATRVMDPEIVGLFLDGRIIYRLTPRTDGSCPD